MSSDRDTGHKENPEVIFILRGVADSACALNVLGQDCHVQEYAAGNRCCVML